MILLLKTSIPDDEDRPPLHERLILIFKERVKDAEDDEDRARAKRDLAKLTRHSPSEKSNDKEGAEA